MLTNEYFLALGIPVVLIICGALARKLVRGTTWQPADFYLGVELALSALASAMVYVVDLAKLTGADPPDTSVPTKLAATGAFLAVCFLLLLSVLSTHQDWEKRTQNPRKQVIWLGIVSNLLGAGLLAAFVLLVKGV